MDMLRLKIEESGYKIGFIADKVGLSRSGLWKKMQEPTTWKVSEMVMVKQLLQLSEEETAEIFNLN